MATLKFKPNEIQKLIMNELVEKWKRKLSRNGIKNIKIKIDKRDHIKLDGPDDSIRKAKKILDI